MRRVTRYALVIVLLAGLTILPGDAVGGDAPRWQSRTEAEAHSRDLDRRVIELQHEIMAARYEGNHALLERAEADLKQTQAERIETLRTLGELR